MADEDEIAVAFELAAGIGDDAVLGRLHRRAFRHRDVDAVIAAALEALNDSAPRRPAEFRVGIAAGAAAGSAFGGRLAVGCGSTFALATACWAFGAGARLELRDLGRLAASQPWPPRAWKTSSAGIGAARATFAGATCFTSTFLSLAAVASPAPRRPAPSRAFRLARRRTRFSVAAWAILAGAAGLPASGDGSRSCDACRRGSRAGAIDRDNQLRSGLHLRRRTQSVNAQQRIGRHAVTAGKHRGSLARAHRHRCLRPAPTNCRTRRRRSGPQRRAGGRLPYADTRQAPGSAARQRVAEACSTGSGVMETAAARRHVVGDAARRARDRHCGSLSEKDWRTDRTVASHRMRSRQEARVPYRQVRIQRSTAIKESNTHDVAHTKRRSITEGD